MKNSGRLTMGLLALSLAMPLAAKAQDNTGVGTNPQVPQPQASPGVNWKGVGVGAGTVVGNLFYMPAKLLYGIGGVNSSAVPGTCSPAATARYPARFGAVRSVVTTY